MPPENYKILQNSMNCAILVLAHLFVEREKKLPIFVRAILANPVSRIPMIILIPTSTILSVMLMRPGRFSGSDSFDELVFAYLILAELFSIALILLIGVWTRDFYIRAIRHIEEHKKIDKRFAREMSAPCQRAGLRLAAKDTGCQIDIS